MHRLGSAAGTRGGDASACKAEALGFRKIPACCTSCWANRGASALWPLTGSQHEKHSSSSSLQRVKRGRRPEQHQHWLLTVKLHQASSPPQLTPLEPDNSISSLIEDFDAGTRDRFSADLSSTARRSTLLKCAEGFAPVIFGRRRPGWDDDAENCSICSAPLGRSRGLTSLTQRSRSITEHALQIWKEAESLKTEDASGRGIIAASVVAAFAWRDLHWASRHGHSRPETLRPPALPTSC